MKYSCKVSRIFIACVLSVLSVKAMASGVCDIITDVQYNPGFFGIGGSLSLPGGRSTYGTGFAAATQNDDSTPANGKISSAIVLKDDAGVNHKLSGKIEVSQNYMVQTPTAAYACLELATTDDMVAIAFQTSSGSDVANTAISAATSGRGYGLKVLSQGGEHYYTTTPASCDYMGQSQQVCDTFDNGNTRCYDQTVTTTTACTQGETETDDQGVETQFGIIDPSGKVVGTFNLIKSKN